MSGVALDKCSLLSIFVESVLWGLFVSLYMITIFLLLQKKSNIVKNVPSLVVVSVMFVLCTMHVSLSFVRVVHAFFATRDPTIYLADVADKIFRLKYGVLFIQIFLGDLLIVFRSFMLWNKNYFVAVGPTFLAIGTLVAAGGALQAMSAASSSDPTFDSRVQTWITASYTLALTTKAICLCLVVFRVRQIHTLITANVNRHITVYTLLVVLVESGAASMLVATILLPTFVAGSNSHNIICDVLSPVTGITVTTITAGMTVKLSSSNPPVASSRQTWNRHSVPRTPISPSRGKNGGWNDFEDDTESHVGSPSTTPSPMMSRRESMLGVNKSTGTLNMGIVI